MKYIYFLSLFIICACGSNTQSQNNITPKDSTTQVASNEVPSSSDAISGATTDSTSLSIKGTITLLPDHYITVSLSIPGIVKKMNVISGAYVNKNDIIAVLENPDFIKLQQEYIDACAQTDYLESEYQRQQTLSQQDAVTKKRVDQSRAEYLSMKSKKDAAKAQLTLLGVNTHQEQEILPYLEVKAAINGYITQPKVNVGKYLNAGDAICSIINKSRFFLKLVLYEKDIHSIKSNDIVVFRVNGIKEKSFKAKIISIGQQVSDINRSLDVYAEVLEHSDQFRPGMYVTAKAIAN